MYLNGEDIRYLAQENTATKDGDTINIIPSIAGGSANSGDVGGEKLSNEEILRYSRHLIMPEVGMEGQLKLKNAKSAADRDGRIGSAAGLVSGGGGRGEIGLGGF